jgi:hypothetical protein
MAAKVVILVMAVGAAALALAVNAQAQSGDTSAGDMTPATPGSGTGMHVSDGSLTGSEITADSSSWPGTDKVWEICCAIATAEGFNRGPGAVPYDLNNPGDLSDGASEFGSQPHSGSNVTTFPTAETGWQWLYNKVQNIVSGGSSVYPQTLSWSGVAQKWAGDWSNWLNNVTSYLGVDPNSTPADYVNG